MNNKDYLIGQLTRAHQSCFLNIFRYSFVTFFVQSTSALLEALPSVSGEDFHVVMIGELSSNTSHHFHFLIFITFHVVMIGELSPNTSHHFHFFTFYNFPCGDDW